MLRTRRRSLASWVMVPMIDRKSTRLNSSHTEIYTLSLHDALPIYHLPHVHRQQARQHAVVNHVAHEAAQLGVVGDGADDRSEEHTSELQSHRDLHSFPTRRSSDLSSAPCPPTAGATARRRKSCCARGGAAWRRG